MIYLVFSNIVIQEMKKKGLSPKEKSYGKEGREELRKGRGWKRVNRGWRSYVEGPPRDLVQQLNSMVNSSVARYKTYHALSH
ncbi:unnamed protein product [Trifolium pratense]|uniref:Uncharacterized protein n=1 Tax=Trifolium pratense TaxID=57577 RepID=A0ACB0JKQ4_TRIPR|nr:unnamed protein product [Trifolium pratense]